MLAVIPAGGAKGVPGKNIRLLAGKPLIVYTIEAALASNIFEKVIVSTDSEEIADFLVSVCKCEHSPMWSGVLDADLSLDNFIDENVKRSCRQELPHFYRLNGAIYMGKTNAFYANKNFFGRNGIAYIMNQDVSADIDSELDFKIAECIMETK